jgi:hypothetical protein
MGPQSLRKAFKNLHWRRGLISLANSFYYFVSERCEICRKWQRVFLMRCKFFLIKDFSNLFVFIGYLDREMFWNYLANGYGWLYRF